MKKGNVKVSSENRKAQINNLEKFVVNELKKNGFAVQLYHSYTSNSVYIKVDYGVCNTIRISDHEGYKNLSYRYNLRTDCGRYRTDRSKPYPQYIFPSFEKKKMIDWIISSRARKIENLGLRGYEQEMKSYRHLNYGKSGFWEKAKLLFDYDFAKVIES